MNDAVAAAHENNWSSALKSARKACELAPDEPVSLLMLIIAQERNELYDDALSNAMRAADTYPDSFLAQYLLGSIFYRQGKYERAIAPLTRAKDLHPTDTNTLFLLGHAKMLTGIEGADQCYISIVNRTNADKSVPYNQLAVIYALKDQPQKALQILQIASKDTNNPFIFLNMGIINDYLVGNPPEARTYYNKFLQLAEGRSELLSEYNDIRQRLLEIRNR